MMDGIREPEWKSEFGGEAENRVAMNWKNGMKKSLNDKRAKAQMKGGGARARNMKGGSERRINVRAVSAFCVYGI